MGTGRRGVGSADTYVGDRVWNQSEYGFQNAEVAVGMMERWEMIDCKISETAWYIWVFHGEGTLS